MMRDAGLRLSRRRWLATAAAALLSGCDGAAPKPSFKGVDITGAEYARKLSLTDGDGQPRTLAEFKGKLVVVFFGFTQCPDVCPTTLTELAEVKKLLGKDGDRLQALFVTVDPERDTPELLKAYMANFDASFLALRPAPASVDVSTAPVSFEEVQAIVNQRCISCHGDQVQMKNLRLDSADQIRANAQNIYQQVVVLKQMPMNNATGLTEPERQALGRWFLAASKP